MRNRILGFLVLISIIAIGCKKEKSVDELDIVKPEVFDNLFKVTLDVVVKKDDDFSLYFKDGSSPDFKEPIWTGVKGSETAQKVIFTIPDEIFPDELRLDFGMKKDQEDVILKSVLLEYNGEKRTIAGAEMGTYFRADESKCTFDPVTGTIKAVVKDGVRQHPSLYTQENTLKAEISKLGK